MSIQRDSTKPPQRHAGPARSSPYPTHRLAPATELVNLAREISRADTMVNTRVTAKLQVIADQIRALQAEARKVMEEAQADQALHRAHCQFAKIPGRVYHLYRKADGSRYFSMLSPKDWGGAPPDDYAGGYRLEADLSWTPAEQAVAPDDSRELVRRLLDAHAGDAQRD